MSACTYDKLRNVSTAQQFRRKLLFIFDYLERSTTYEKSVLDIERVFHYSLQLLFGTSSAPVNI
jgi:hypothetical protein